MPGKTEPVQQNTEETSVARGNIINMLPPVVKRRAEELPTDYLEKTEKELEELFRPTPRDWLVRKNLWKEYEKAEISGAENIQIQPVIRGVCTDANFYNFMIRQPERLAWYLIKPSTYTNMIDQGLYIGLQKMLDFMQKNEMTPKTANVYMKAIQFLADREMGPVIQRIEQKTMQANVSMEQLSGNVSGTQDLLEKYESIKTKLVSGKLSVEVNEDIEPE